MQDILQAFKISDFKISQRFLAACTRFQRVAGPSPLYDIAICYRDFQVAYNTPWLI